MFAQSQLCNASVASSIHPNDTIVYMYSSTAFVVMFRLNGTPDLEMKEPFAVFLTSEVPFLAMVADSGC